MLLAMAERRLRIAERLARCFPDRRDPTRTGRLGKGSHEHHSVAGRSRPRRMASSQASVEYFLTAGHTHGARIANDVLGLISDIIRGLDVLEQQRSAGGQP